jgi:hypothetical protein
MSTLSLTADVSPPWSSKVIQTSSGVDPIALKRWLSQKKVALQRLSTALNTEVLMRNNAIDDDTYSAPLRAPIGARYRER